MCLYLSLNERAVAVNESVLVAASDFCGADVWRNAMFARPFRPLFMENRFGIAKTSLCLKPDKRLLSGKQTLVLDGMSFCLVWNGMRHPRVSADKLFHPFHG